MAFKALLDLKPHLSPQPVPHNAAARWKILHFSLTCQAIFGYQYLIHEVPSAWSYSTIPLKLG
jgi:hypothetical protein